MTDPSPTQVVTGRVRLSYCHVFQPYSQNPGPDNPAKYSTAILIPKSDRKTLADIDRAIQAAAEKGKSTKFGGRIPPNLSTTLHDGDEEADLEKNPEYAGHMYMNVASKTRPGIIDAQKNPILDETEVYSGCYARVAINAFAYNNSGNRGISFGLNHVQKLADGDPLGGITRAEDVFDVVDVEDDESSLI